MHAHGMRERCRHTVTEAKKKTSPTFSTRPVYPYGFAVIPTDSDLKFRCYARWVKNYGHCPIFLPHILSWSKTTGTGSKLSKGQNQVMTGNYFPWNTDCACPLLKLFLPPFLKWALGRWAKDVLKIRDWLPPPPPHKKIIIIIIIKAIQRYERWSCLLRSRKGDSFIDFTCTHGGGNDCKGHVKSILLLSLNAHYHVDDYSGTFGSVRKVHISALVTSPKNWVVALSFFLCFSQKRKKKKKKKKRTNELVDCIGNVGPWLICVEHGGILYMFVKRRLQCVETTLMELLSMCLDHASVLKLEGSIPIYLTLTCVRGLEYRVDRDRAL